MTNEFKDTGFQCEMLPNGQPKYYPNEKILIFENLLKILEEDKIRGLKVYHGRAIVTTHRLLYLKNGYGVEIPYHYMLYVKTEEAGFYASDHVKVILD